MTETHRRALEWLLRAYEYREVKAGAGPWKLTAALRAALAEIDQLRQVLQSLRIDANRLCDRQLGGTYEEDCRRSLAKIEEVLRSEATP